MHDEYKLTHISDNSFDLLECYNIKQEYFNNEDGYKNFTIVKVKINKIIFLQLNQNGNKKFLVKYGKKNINYHWLVA